MKELSKLSMSIAARRSYLRFIGTKQKDNTKYARAFTRESLKEIKSRFPSTVYFSEYYSWKRARTQKFISFHQPLYYRCFLKAFVLFIGLDK